MKKRIIIIAIAAVVVAAAGVGIMAYLIQGSPAKALNATELSVGEKYLAELNYTQATATLEHVIMVEPNNAEAYLALARTYRYMGDFDTARETLENGYSATNSAVIEWELSTITSESGGVTDTTATNVPTVEIDGRVYASDITELVLRDCGLTDADLEKLSGFTNLERLDISGNGISDISAVGRLTVLKKFYAANNAISDISALASLQSLEYIGLRGNLIANADALFGISGLKYLHLSDNQISSVPTLGSALRLLYLANNKIADANAVTSDNLLYCDISGNAGI